MMHRIILVREWDSQTSSSGCCGKLGGEQTELGDPDTFKHNREEMEKMGRVYRALREDLFDEEVEMTVVDPRNMVWLIPSVLKDARRRGLSISETFKQINKGVSYNAVILDGKVLFSGHIPEPDEAVSTVRSELDALEPVGV
ncbi:MAG: hypothetical protein M3N10_05385 [Actinomycetota bacterium]|nr:hypothetical protein [Actinomycetota bacterium]HZY65199.1 hypothetical protein [Rubrobacteraceae bacterium]